LDNSVFGHFDFGHFDFGQFDFGHFDFGHFDFGHFDSGHFAPSPKDLGAQDRKRLFYANQNFWSCFCHGQRPGLPDYFLQKYQKHRITWQCC
jgi:hypothetical protein